MGRGNRGGGCIQKPYRQKFLMRQMLLLTEQIEAWISNLHTDTKTQHEE